MMTETADREALQPLAVVLRRRAKRMLDRDDPEGLEPEARDNAELMLVLARVIEGRSLTRAFGAPGDWGYETEIGGALAAAYRQLVERNR